LAILVVGPASANSKGSKEMPGRAETKFRSLLRKLEVFFLEQCYSRGSTLTTRVRSRDNERRMKACSKSAHVTKNPRPHMSIATFSVAQRLSFFLSNKHRSEGWLTYKTLVPNQVHSYVYQQKLDNTPVRDIASISLHSLVLANGSRYQWSARWYSCTASACLRSLFPFSHHIWPHSST
jgi:hypothetical protein